MLKNPKDTISVVTARRYFQYCVPISSSPHDREGLKMDTNTVATAVEPSLASITHLARLLVRAASLLQTTGRSLETGIPQDIKSIKSARHNLEYVTYELFYGIKIVNNLMPNARQPLHPEGFPNSSQASSGTLTGRGAFTQPRE
jgi:hypothetical protein